MAYRLSHLLAASLAAVVGFGSTAYAVTAAYVAPPEVTGTTPSGMFSSGPINIGGTMFSSSGQGPTITQGPLEGSAAYSWTFSGNTDPTLSWTFGAAVPGHYDILFMMPYVGGPYNTIKSIAGNSVSDIGTGTSPTSVTGVSIVGKVNGTVQPGVTLTGDVTAPNGKNASLGYGPKTASGVFPATGSLSINLIFDLTSADLDGNTAFNGLLTLSEVKVPEPMTMTLIGSSLAGLALIRRRRN